MRYTERLPCAAAARTRSTYPGGNPGYISGLAPLRLDLRARANEPRPASATKRRWCAGRCSGTRALRLRRNAGVMGVAKNLSVGIWRRRESTEELIPARSTVAETPARLRAGVRSNKERCFGMGKIQNSPVE